jgi:hypothetical protein
MVTKGNPPKWAVVLVKLASIGEYGDEHEDYFYQKYDQKVEERGEDEANRWARWFAAKTVIHAVWQLIKSALTIYIKLAGG